MQAARQVFQDIGPKLNLSANVLVENLPPVEAKRYLTRNHFKCCVLVMDVQTIKDDYGNVPRRKVEYEELLETAANEVGKTAVKFLEEIDSVWYPKRMKADIYSGSY